MLHRNRCIMGRRHADNPAVGCFVAHVFYHSGPLGVGSGGFLCEGFGCWLVAAFSKCLDVGEVLPSASGAFRCKHVLNPARPCGFKLNAWNCREDVDAGRLAAHRKNGPGSAKSAEVRPSSGAPNSAKAAKTAFALSGSAFTRMSRSLVARGCAWIATA